MNIFNTPVTVLPGIGEKRKLDFDAAGIHSLYDLLYFFPTRYQDRSAYSYIEALEPGQETCLRCVVKSPVRTIRVKRTMTISNCILEDETGEIMAVWYNRKYLDNQLKTGEEYVFFGKVEKGKSRLEFRNSLIEKAEHAGRFTGKVIPVYSLGSKISPKIFQSAVEHALEYAKELLPSFLPPSLEQRYGLMEYHTALRTIHFPEHEEEAAKARERFVFEEFFLFQAGIAKMRKAVKKQGPIFADTDYRELEKRLPFSLTQAQHKVIGEIMEDLKRPVCMNRLIQGDVGSGKTAVAAAAFWVAVKNGYQGAMMAPTEILAKQHWKSLSGYLNGARIALLTSSIAKKDKQEILSQLKSGQIDLIIGTHALLEENVEFCRLGLVVTDEQHRFGVNQRKKLVRKGPNPHVMIMTATPIPRTLAMILYGDLDISTIDQLPPGRQEIKTYCLGNSFRNRVYEFVRKKVKEGRQVYVVCPLVEESETLQLTDATSLAEKMAAFFTDAVVGLLHGRMKEEEKNSVMERFRNREIDILVATTVVEVGVDVANATVMIIENAERFGLSQLHQLRGRVGRGQEQSYCILFANTKNPETIRRLKVIEHSSDGFYISQQDLELRGPGDFFGTRQHGLPVLKTANPVRDMDLLYQSKEAVSLVISRKVALTGNQSKLLKFFINKMFYQENDGEILS